MEDDFGWRPLKDVDDRVVYTIWGGKGVGKTTIAFGFPGQRDVLSYDRKAMRVRRSPRFAKDPHIRVHDAIEYLDYAEDKYLESCDKNFQFVVYTLQQIIDRGGTDWVIHDGAETFIKTVEMRMRHRYNFKAAQGISERSVWNYRNLDLKLIHDLSMQAARKGVIYTVQQVKDEIIVDGTLVKATDAPRWTDVIMTETDVVLRALEDPKSGKFSVVVTTSKEDGIPTAAVLDVTCVGANVRSLWDALRERRCPTCGSTLVTKGPVRQCLKYPDCKFVEKVE